MSKTRRAQDKREAFLMADKEGRRQTDYTKEIEFLLTEARMLIAGQNYAAAVWRLVDAAGICVRQLPKEKRKNLIGWHNRTQRGFKLNAMMEGTQ
jgi:hypothetical protein